MFFFLCAFQQVKKLQAILKPMMLRRLKDDVEKNLAPKEETIIEVELCVFERNFLTTAEITSILLFWLFNFKRVEL